MFGPAADVGLDPGGGQLLAQLLHHLVDVLLAVEAPLVQQLGDLLVLIGLQVAERQVLEFPLDVADAETMGQRRVDVEHLAGHPVALVVVGVLHRADRAGALGQLDQRHAHVVDHGHQHLAQVLDLRLGAEDQRLARVEAGADRRHAQHAFDQLGHRRAEVLLHRLQLGLALAHRTVEHRGDQRLLVEAQIGENLRDLQAGAETGRAFGPDVLDGDRLLLGLAGELAGLAQTVAIQGRIDAEDVIQPGLEVDAAVGIDRLLRSYLYHRLFTFPATARHTSRWVQGHLQALIAPTFCGPVHWQVVEQRRLCARPLLQRPVTDAPHPLRTMPSPRHAPSAGTCREYRRVSAGSPAAPAGPRRAPG
ncbi:hypothetical protein D3C80_891690 [compost metagenome]